MIVYRLNKYKYKNDLSGKGAEIAGGRWNSKGNALLYTCASRALCVAEVAVHLPLGIIPKDYCLIEIAFPDRIIIQECKTSFLPGHWQRKPHVNATQKIGDQFLRKNLFLVMKVPSAVVQGDFNYLINPGHKDFSLVKIKSIEKFSFDERLFI